MITREALLSAQDETELARSIEAGVLAQAVLRGDFPRPEGCTDAELLSLADAGERARERFLLANVGLVRSLAHAQARRLSLDADELFQEGFLALMVAVAKWDHRRGIRFGSYAGGLIQHAVLLAAGNRCGELHVTPSQARTIRRAQAVRRRLESDGSAAGVAEVARASGRSERWASEVLAYSAPTRLTPVMEDLVAAAPDTGEEERHARQLLAVLPPREREVLWWRHGFGGRPLTAVEVGRRLDCSAATVRRLEVRALERLRGVEARQARLAG